MQVDTGRPMSGPGVDVSTRMLFKGNSSRLELLIEKIQANKENHNDCEQDIKDALGTDPGSSWRSETPEDATSPSPSSCATPNSATDVADSELAFTVGVTEGTPYACSFCDKAFPRLSYLKKHEQTHSDQMPFRCEFCSRLFKHKRSRDRHIKLHTGDKKYRCNQCEAAFSRSDHLKIHMKTHDNQKPFQCTVCNRGYNTAAALTSHMQNHKKAADSASNGGASNGRSSSRASSDNTPSPGTFRCLQCGDCFRKPEDLQSHMATQHHVDMGSPPSRSASRGLLLDSPLPRSPFPLHGLACIYCTKDSFPSMEALQLHVQAMHGSLLNGELRDLAARVRPPVEDSPRGSPPTQHHPPPPSPSGPAPPGSGNAMLPCELCTMRFNSIAGLHKHQRAVHGLLAPKLLGDQSPIVCVHCSLPFPSSAAFAEHYVLVHSGGAGLGGLTVRTPSPASRDHQEKPTDLSLGRKASSRRAAREDKLGSMPPSKRSKANHELPPLLLDGHGLGREYEAGTLLCNQCGAALPDFEAFRVHLKAHLEESGGLRSLLSADLLGLLPPVVPPPHPPSHADEPSARSRGGRSPAPSRRSPCSPVPLSCPHCGVQFQGLPAAEERILLERHVAEHFLATATEFGCPACAKLFAKPDELQKHLMDIHALHLYRCSLCQELFDSKVAIQVHFAVKHSSACPLYRCTACPPSSAAAVFRSEREFGMHVRASHATHPLLAATHAMLLQHQQSFHERERRDQRDRERDKDRDRDRDREALEQGAYRCMFCRAAFGSELELQFHLPTHTKQFHCPICQETFQVEFLLDKHMQTHHSNQLLNGRDTPSTGSVEADRKPPKPSSKSQQHHQGAANGIGGTKTNGDTADPLLNNNQDGASCDICERGDFASEAELAAHRKLAHHSKSPGTGAAGAGAGGGSKNGAVSLLCAYCNENCKSRTELENHMKTHSQGTGASGKHKCNICDELCPSAGVLAEHKLTHCKVLQGSTCTVCRASVASEEAFRAHMRQHSAQPGAPPPANISLPSQCVICRQTLVSDVEVRLHARFHLQGTGAAETPTVGDPPATAPCCICLQTCDTASMLPAGQSMSYVCKDCYRRHSKFSSRSPPPPSRSGQGTPQQSPRLEESGVKQEAGAGGPRCSECGVQLDSTAALDAHMASVHKNTYQCIKCQASFETERDIRLHVSAHLLAEGAAANECRLCRRQLSTPLQLQLHLIEHTFAGCQSFTCYICSSVFTAARGLQAHMLEHGLAARPYDCSLCGLRFFFRAELDNHTLGHHAQGRPGEDEDSSNAAVQASFYQHLSNLSNLSNGLDASPPQLDLHYYTVPGEPTSVSSKSPRKSSGRGSRDSVRSGLKQRCLICGKDYPSARSLASHLRSHHGLQENGLDGLALGLGPGLGPQVCILCKEIFQDRDSLLVHLALQHPGASSLLQLDMAQAFLSQAHAQAQAQACSRVKQELAVKEEVEDQEEESSGSVQGRGHTPVPVSEEERTPTAPSPPPPSKSDSMESTDEEPTETTTSTTPKEVEESETKGGESDEKTEDDRSPDKTVGSEDESKQEKGSES